MEHYGNLLRVKYQFDANIRTYCLQCINYSCKEKVSLRKERERRKILSQDLFELDIEISRRLYTLLSVERREQVRIKKSKDLS